MSFRNEIRAHLAETGESKRALSLRSGLNARAITDILSIEGLKPRHSTLAALSEAIGRDLLTAETGSKPLTWGELTEKLNRCGEKTRASRVRGIMAKANWYGNKRVCRHDVIDFFEQHSATSLGLSPSSRSTYKCDILAAIDRHCRRDRPRGVVDLGGIWADAYAAVKDSDIPTDCRLKAGPFFVYLFDRGIMPNQITSETLAGYYAYRLEMGVVTEAKCRKHVGNVVTLLRHMRTDPSTAHFGFVAAASPFSDRRDKFGVATGELKDLLNEYDNCLVPWASGNASRDGSTYEAFLAELDREEAKPVCEKKARLRKSVASKSKHRAKAGKEERVERREAKMREYGFLTEDARWSSTTLKTRRGYVISLAKALAGSHDIIVTSLRELVDYEYLAEAAKALSEANGGRKDTGYLVSVLKTMKKIAIGYAAVSDPEVDDIKSLIRFYETGRQGIAPQNKAKLRKFTESRIQSTIDLSGSVMKRINAEIDRRRKAERKKTGVLPDRVGAINLELARDIAAVLAHDVMLTRAPRSSNVIEAMLDWVAFQDDRAVLSIPALQVKGRRKGDPDYVVRLGERASRLMRNYIDKIRPLLLHPGDDENPYLFPGQNGRQFTLNSPYRGLLKRVVRLLHQEVGVWINPHLYRHLVGWIWLKESMDNLPRVQQLLGHKSLQTTVEYYAELDDTLVMDGWQTYLETKMKASA